MGFLNIFSKKHKQGTIIHSKKYPEYNMYFEFLEMVNGKRINEMFFGNTSLIPNHLRDTLKNNFEQSVKNGLVYVTEGNESIANSFRKNDFVKILKDNNLPVTGNKIDLIERIEKEIGVNAINDIGKVSDWIKLTELGKSKISEYKIEFNQQYDEFQQEIYNLFLSNSVLEACNKVDTFRKLYPFERSDFFTILTGKSLLDTCKEVRKSDILIKIGIPKMYHAAILSIMCTYFSFADFDYIGKIKEIYNDFEEVLINSKLVVNKDYPYKDFQNLLRRYDIKKINI